MPVREILFADNDPDFLNTRAEFLEDADYRVLKAYTLEQAQQLLADTHVHLAILDIRMVDDDDEKDVSGLTLAKDPAYRSIPKIMLTGFPSYQYVREALGPALDGLPPAVDFLSKKEGPEAMIQAVERAFAQHVCINWDLHIRWDERGRLSFPHLVTLIEPGLEDDRLPDRVGELEDLLRRLFYEKSQITIGRLLWHREERGCVAVFTFSPEGVSEPLVITCGLRPRIEQEIARCEKFAPKGGTATVLLTSAETMHFAAVAYALPKADLEQAQTFEEFYQTNKAGQVREVLRHLFQITLAAWNQGGRILEETKSLGQLYRQRLNLSWEALPQEELERRMKALAKEALSFGPTVMEFSAHRLLLRFPNSDTISYPNPIPHVYEEAEAVENGPPVVCRITPGTLSGDNILVDQVGRTWLTDSARAGPVPFLWDFVSLEAMVRFDLVESADLQALHEFEKRLVTPARLNERLDTQDIDPQFRKALGVIQEIRRQAFSATEADPTSYYEGLLFRAISGVAGYAPGIRYSPQELARPVHALLAAAMICGRITQIVGGLFSEGSSAVRGIEIDEANHQVWVEGRQVALSPTEFDALLYLYNHPGQLCTRRSIVEEGLKGKYIGNQQEASRINTTIGRLRGKIEPDPEHHRYILTVRGKGYKLCLGDEDRS